jgi:PAS domain-containing protein
MADEDKTREQLMDELFELRRRVSELETPHNTCVQTEEALDLTRHTLQTTLDAVKASVSVLDLDFNLTHVNDVLVKMMGLPVKDSALGRKCFKVLRGRSEICPASYLHGCSPAWNQRQDSGDFRLSRYGQAGKSSRDVALGQRRDRAPARCGSLGRL